MLQSVVCTVDNYVYLSTSIVSPDVELVLLIPS
jgi:hypothetical protein